MPRPNRPYYERFRTDVLGIYIGAALIVLGFFVFSQYTTGWQWSLSSPSIWLLIGYSVLAGGCLWWGFASAFRRKTRKLFCGNYVFEISHPEPIPVITQYYAVRKDLLQNELPQSYTQDIDRAVAVMPGTDGYGYGVIVEARALGGFDAYGFHSLEGGQQGYVILRGTTQLIQIGSNYFSPHTFEPLDHSMVDPKFIAYLKATQSNFVENVTPIFDPGPLDGNVKKWLEISPAAQAHVLQAIGYEGLVDKFVTRLENQLATSTTITAKEFQTAWRNDVKKAIMDAFRQWLTGQDPLKMAMGFNEATTDFWRTTALGYLSELTKAEARLELKSDTIYTHERETNQIARRRAAINRVPPSQGPSYDQAERRPNEIEA